MVPMERPLMLEVKLLQLLTLLLMSLMRMQVDKHQLGKVDLERKGHSIHQPHQNKKAQVMGVETAIRILIVVVQEGRVEMDHKQPKQVKVTLKKVRQEWVVQNLGGKTESSYLNHNALNAIHFMQLR